MAKEVAHLYRVNGFVEMKFPADGKKFSLEELQKFVGGHIEKVPGTARRGKPVAYCNEDGRSAGLPFNFSASTKFGFDLLGDVVQVIRGGA